MDDTAAFRNWFADELAYTAPIHSMALRDAFAAVPRELFLGPGPWTLLTRKGALTTPDCNPARVYHDVPIVLNSEKGINNGMPRLWASHLDRLKLRPGESVLHVGAGSGYYTAIIANLVGATGHVSAREIDEKLESEANSNLAGWKNVHVSSADAMEAIPKGLDVVVASAGLSEIPMSWLRALSPGGRLLLPLTADGEWPVPGDPTRTWKGGSGAMLLVRRNEKGFEAEFLDPVAFIHCRGGRSRSSEEPLRAALQRGDYSSVKSLRLGNDADDGAWVAGDGWWLSRLPL